MEFLGEVVAWFTDPGNWSGSDGIPARLVEHLVLAGIPLAIAVAVALPVGLLIGHTGRGALAAISIANIGRALPSLAILVIFLPLTIRAGLGLGFWPTIIALTVLAIPPIVTNTFVGLREVDADLVETGRGMGMRGWQILRRVEVPLALPVILAGMQIAAVQVVATATLGAVIASGGLGRYIIDGIAQGKDQEVFSGALIVAALAILTQLLFTGLQGLAVSPGLRERTASPMREPAQTGRSGPGF